MHFLEGKKVALRPLRERDINERYLSWINDKEITKYMETCMFPTSLAQLQNYYKRPDKSKTDVMFAIVDKKKKRFIGTVKLGNINWVHRFAFLGIMIGEKKYWNKGYGREACRLLLEYAFRRLNLNKVILGVYEVHRSGIKAYKKAGFKIEGRLKRILSFEGRYVDKIFMGISRDEFR